MFKNFLKMNAGDFSLYAAITGGLFLLGEVVILCVMAFMKPDTSIFLAGIVLPIVGAFSLFLMSFTNSTVMFDTALRFGRTRKGSSSWGWPLCWRWRNAFCCPAFGRSWRVLRAGSWG